MLAPFILGKTVSPFLSSSSIKFKFNEIFEDYPTDPNKSFSLKGDLIFLSSSS